MKFRKITEQDRQEWVTMAMDMLSDIERHEWEQEFMEYLEGEKLFDSYIGINENGETVSFIQLAIRRDYVEGSSTNPVAYIEGIYVKPEYRNKGIAREMVKLAEQWGRDHNCSELGSDVELDNIESQKFHKKVGFKEANRLVAYMKKI